jgi:hypothetical protein
MRRVEENKRFQISDLRFQRTAKRDRLGSGFRGKLRLSAAIAAGGWRVDCVAIAERLAGASTTAKPFRGEWSGSAVSPQKVKDAGWQPALRREFAMRLDCDSGILARYERLTESHRGIE